MADRDAIYAMLSELITNATGRDHIVSPDTPLSALGLDSLGLIEVIFELEERYDVDLPFNANDIAKQGQEPVVGDIVEMVIAARAVDNSSSDATAVVRTDAKVVSEG